MKVTLSAFALLTALAAAPPVFAQGAPAGAGTTGSPWSVEGSIGWDNSISGDFLSGAIGTFGGNAVTLNKQGWDDIYGTGVFFNATVGYALGEMSEVRGGFTWQSTGTNELATIGSIATQPLTVEFDDYKSWALDAGYRQYFAERAERLRPYVGGSIGFGQVKDIDAVFTAGNFVGAATPFYEGNGTFVLGLNGGVIYGLTSRLFVDGRIGLRYTSGLSDVNDALFTGFDDVNNDSSRWTLPITVGLRFQF
jgi:hypothetical protein